MIKAIHITSVVIGIGAVFFIIFSFTFGSDSVEDVKEIVKSTSAIEKFKTFEGNSASRNGNRSSPLVKEAKAFALYLNPPPKPKPKRTPVRQTRKEEKTPPRRPSNHVSTKFKLIGTAYHPLSPETSMALVDQPGTGLRWVKQGESLDHLLFKEIKDGVIILRDGGQTRQMEVPLKAEDQTVQKFTVGGDAISNNTATKKSLLSRVQVSPKSTREPRPPQPVIQADPEEKKIISDVFSSLMRGDLKDSNSNNEAFDKLISTLSKTRMDEYETNRLRTLGETLEKIQEMDGDEPNIEPNSEPNLNPDTAKTRRSTR